MADETADVENQYYKAKGIAQLHMGHLHLPPWADYDNMIPGLKEDDPDAALKAFRAIVDGQAEKGEW